MYVHDAHTQACIYKYTHRHAQRYTQAHTHLHTITRKDAHVHMCMHINTQPCTHVVILYYCLRTVGLKDFFHCLRLVKLHIILGSCRFFLF